MWLVLGCKNTLFTQI